MKNNLVFLRCCDVYSNRAYYIDMNFNWTQLDSAYDLDIEYSKRFCALVDHYKLNPPHSFENRGVFGDEVDNEWTTTMALTFQSWRDNKGQAPSLVSVLSAVIQYFDIPEGHALVPVALTACVLGMIDHKNAYHNNDHFREVLCMLIKLIIMHNTVNRNPLMTLNHDDILLLVTVAAIHDFAHDGNGNIVDGVHIPSRLENNAFNCAEPFFDAMGVNQNYKNMIKQMIIATDVSRGDMGRSPAGYTRDVFLAHIHDNVSIVNAPGECHMLLESEKLTLMCILMCEADIAMSSGLDYEFSKEMTKLIAEESSVLQANANTLHGFMEVICHGGYLSRAAQLIMGQSFQAILLQAEADKEENVLYA